MHLPWAWLCTAVCLPAAHASAGRVPPAEGLLPHTTLCGKYGLVDLLANTIQPSAAVVDCSSLAAFPFPSQSIRESVKVLSSFLFICVLVWLCWVLLLHISISAYCYSGLCSLVCFSQANCGFKSKGKDSQAHGNYHGFVRVIFLCTQVLCHRSCFETSEGI